MTQKLKEFVRNASDDQIDSIVGTSVTVIMLIEVALTVGAYIAIKYLAGPIWAEGFMLAAYARIILKMAPYIEAESKQQLINECSTTTIDDLTNGTKETTETTIDDNTTNDK